MSNVEPERVIADKLPRRQTRFLNRHIVSSDNHGFVGRIYELSIISLHFATYDDLSKYPDCKYAVDTNHWLSGLTARVESLNLAGNMLWPDPIPTSFKKVPVTRYEWLTIAADVFIVRYISVIDCAFLLINQVYDLELKPRDCTFGALKKASIPAELITHLQLMLDEQHAMRAERNGRIHHGNERTYTDDDDTFRTASMFADRGAGITGTDYYGRPVNVDISFREGLVRLQKDFNRNTKKLEAQLDDLYDFLWGEFETRFEPLIAAATHGLNARQS